MNTILSMIAAALLWLVLKCFIPTLEDWRALVAFLYAGLCAWTVCSCWSLKKKGE